MKRLAFSFFLLVCLGASVQAAERKPNILFLLADDLGWGDLGCHGNTKVKTPNLDRFAKEGTDFQQFNVASPVCSPSRVAFMTGKFPARFSVHQAIGGVRKNAESKTADWLDAGAATLPRLLKTAGYVTAHLGKWHLCSSQAEDAPVPADYGVDEHALFVGTSPPRAENHTKEHEIFDAAVDFIRRHREQPFYLNVWMHETHLAHYPTEESLKEMEGLDERQRIYSAVALDADRGVGKILAALRELRLEQDTLVLFSSDNGPENTHPTNKEMRGGYGGYYSVGEPGGRGRKRSLYEGGVRTPLLVRWPGHVPAGRIDASTPIASVDFLPTLCAAAGVQLPRDYAGDGESMLGAFQGREGGRAKPLFWDWNGVERPAHCWPRWAMGSGDWKLLTDDGQKLELYAVSDRTEEHDVAKDHPEIVQKLAAELASWRASLPADRPDNVISKKHRRGPVEEAAE